jgi:hypothetical protein
VVIRSDFGMTHGFAVCPWRFSLTISMIFV